MAIATALAACDAQCVRNSDCASGLACGPDGACSTASDDDGGGDAAGDEGTDADPTDADPADADPTDADPTDAAPTDAGPTDAGPADAGPADAGPADAGIDGRPGFDRVPSQQPLTPEVTCRRSRPRSTT